MAISLMGESRELQAIRLEEELARLRAMILARLERLEAENQAAEELSAGE